MNCALKPASRTAVPALLDGRRYAVIGAGVSGLAAVRLLLSLGREVRLLDDRDASASVQVAQFTASGVQSAWGPFTPETAAAALHGCDRAVVSPGVKSGHILLEAAAAATIPVWPEIELAWLRSDGARTVAVTGTNGKTTVTMMIRHILSHCGLAAVETGNIGHAFCDAVREAGAALPDTVFAAELSSFQLETIHDFAPDIALVLNITPDHLDRHGTHGRATPRPRRALPETRRPIRCSSSTRTIPNA
jgi:UDP-N-acetylmuramoylalanine--D-glutamate ligase